MTTGLLVAGETAHLIVAAQRSGDDRRHRADRRQQPTSMFSRYTLFGGRRQLPRRAEEREGSFVDRYGSRVFAMVMVIVVLNLLDAWFTLLFLSYGARELNPFVQSILDLSQHPWPFLVFKTIGIGIACCFLTITKNFRSARIGLWFVMGGYTVLLTWHVYLLSRLDIIA